MSDDKDKDKPGPFDDYFNKDLEGIVAAWVEEASMGDQPTSTQCRVCKDPVIRDLVNNLIAHGYTIPDMLATLDKHNLQMRVKGQPEITKSSLYNHRTEHFDIQSPAHAIWRRIQEHHQSTYQSDWQTGVGGVLNALSYYHIMMMKGFETLTNPKFIVTPEQGAWAAGRLDAMLASKSDVMDAAQHLAETGRIVEAVRHFVSPEDWPRFKAVVSGEVELEDAEADDDGVEMVMIADEDDE
jgi:hypothetical protein